MVAPRPKQQPLRSGKMKRKRKMTAVIRSEPWGRRSHTPSKQEYKQGLCKDSVPRSISKGFVVVSQSTRKVRERIGFKRTQGWSLKLVRRLSEEAENHRMQSFFCAEEDATKRLLQHTTKHHDVFQVTWRQLHPREARKGKMKIKVKSAQRSMWERKIARRIMWQRWSGL